MRTMAVEVTGVIIATIEVPAVDVVDISVTIIIDPVICDLSRILPDICSEIRMGIHDPGINDGDDYVLGSRSERPCLWCINISVHGAGLTLDRLPGVMQTPEIAKPGIIWDAPSPASTSRSRPGRGGGSSSQQVLIVRFDRDVISVVVVIRLGVKNIWIPGIGRYSLSYCYVLWQLQHLHPRKANIAVVHGHDRVLLSMHRIRDLCQPVW